MRTLPKRQPKAVESTTADEFPILDVSIENMLELMENFDGTVDDPQYDESDVQQSTDHVDELMERLDKISVGTEGLDNLLQILRARKDQPVSPEELTAYQMTFEAHCAVLDVSLENTKDLPATTIVSLESKILDVIKRIWEAIKNTLKMIWKSLQEIFYRIINSTAGIRRVAAQLKKDIESIKHEDLKERDIDPHQFQGMVMYKRAYDLMSGGYLHPRIDPNQIGKSCTELHELLVSSGGIMKAYIHELQELSSGRGTKDAMMKVLKSNHVGSLGFAEQETSSGVTTHSTNLLAGGYVIKLSYTLPTNKDSGVDSADENVAALRTYMSSIKVESEHKDDYSLHFDGRTPVFPALPFDHLIPGINLVLKITDYLDATKEGARAFKAYVDLVMKDGDIMVKRVSNVMGGKDYIPDRLLLSAEAVDYRQADEVDPDYVKVVIEYYKHIADYLYKLMTMSTYRLFKTDTALLGYLRWSWYHYSMAKTIKEPKE